MWSLHPPAPAPRRRTAQAPPKASQAHTRRQSTSSTHPHPAPAPRVLPRRIISLQDNQGYAGTLPPVPERTAAKMQNSYSLPSGLTAASHNHTHNGAAAPRPSRRDPVHVSAPQDLGGEQRSDRESQSARIVRSTTRRRSRRSFSTSSYLFLANENETDDGGRALKVYNYMPGGYWAGRLSSVLDRLAAEMPAVAAPERVKRAFGALDVVACGPGAEQSLMEFKKAFDRRLKEGRPW